MFICDEGSAGSERRGGLLDGAFLLLLQEYKMTARNINQSHFFDFIDYWFDTRAKYLCFLL
jgi:hypothetical protein